VLVSEILVADNKMPTLPQLPVLFNNKYLELLQVLRRSFHDDKGIVEYCASIRTLLDQSNDFPELLSHFQQVTERAGIIQRIYEHDPTLIMNDELVFWLDGYESTDENGYSLKGIWERLDQSERDIFFKHVCFLCKISALINACGPSLGPMEDLARKFIDKNGSNEMDPDELFRAVFKEVRDGGGETNKSLQDIMGGIDIDNLFKQIQLLSMETGQSGPSGQSGQTGRTDQTDRTDQTGQTGQTQTNQSGLMGLLAQAGQMDQTDQSVQVSDIMRRFVDTLKQSGNGQGIDENMNPSEMLKALNLLS
jgi:hypothetical protein